LRLQQKLLEVEAEESAYSDASYFSEDSDGDSGYYSIDYSEHHAAQWPRRHHHRPKPVMVPAPPVRQYSYAAVQRTYEPPRRDPWHGFRGARVLTPNDFVYAEYSPILVRSRA
jgi:hypothetical protein